MKKRFFAVLLAVALVISVCSFTSCAKPQDVKVKDEFVSITSFETYDEVRQMHKLNNFGSIDNSCRQHVTDGRYASKLEINGNYLNKVNPVIGIKTGTEWVAKRDYTDVDKVLLDVYNDNDYEANVYFNYLVTDRAMLKSTSAIMQTVKAKTQATVEFIVDRDIVCQLLDLKNVEQLRISFDCSTTYDQPYRNFVIDNLRVHVTDVAPDLTKPMRKADEFECADKADFLALWSNVGDMTWWPSYLDFNKDPAYIKSGNGSFKMTSSGNGMNDQMGWQANSPIHDVSGYSKLSFWVYIVPDDAAEHAVMMYGLNPDGSDLLNQVVETGKWVNIEVTIEAIKNSITGNVELLGNSFYDVKDLAWIAIKIKSDRNIVTTAYIDEMYFVK